FFQAEDGIRDRNVTGVQTCALPICPLLVTILLIAFSYACGSGSPTSPAPVANFQGQYTGTYSVASCTETAAYVGFCASAGFTNSIVLPIALSLTQNQSTVTGTLTLGALTGSFSGAVQTAGNL